MSKAGAYIGGHTVITVRRGPKDMARRQAHWKRKFEREQREHDAERQAERDTVLAKIAAHEVMINERRRLRRSQRDRGGLGVTVCTITPRSWR
jgi:hypothetical protein